MHISLVVDNQYGQDETPDMKPAAEQYVQHGVCESPYALLFQEDQHHQQQGHSDVVALSATAESQYAN